MRRLAAALGTILAGAVIGLGCSSPSVFECESSEECRDGTREGVCTDLGYCAFEDFSCASGLAYGELSAPRLVGSCVPEGGTGAGSGTGSASGTGGGSSAAASEGSPATSAASGIEPECPAGVSCEPDDPCAVSGTCSADGVCVPSGTIDCNAPPGPCVSARGECQPDGSCAYDPLPAASECEDGDPCTQGDQCNGMGACVPGPVCPDLPCQVAECTAMGCAYSPAPNGTSCGAASADRCCNGACVDISSDGQHCGGCNTACIPGQECEPVEVTSTCEAFPAETSGRCRCALANDECPPGQICRTQSPYAGRCTPEGNAGCDGVFVEVQLCPNYCTY